MIWAACLAAMLFVQPTHAQDKDKKDKTKQPKDAKKVRRVVYSVELATHKKAKFSGKVTLAVAPPHRGPALEYYWGGKCKQTRLSSTRLELLYEAMKHGYAVEIPSKPIKYDGRIHMCMTALRVYRYKT